MRLFFALDINSKDKANIARWREELCAGQHGRLPCKAIAQNNFHITLCFLGNITNEQQQGMVQCAEHFSHHATGQPLRLLADHCALFRKPQVLYLGISQVPDKLQQLASQLKKHAQQLHIFQEDRCYKPHVSVLRKAKYLPSLTHEPRIPLTIASFSLYQSIADSQGVRYQRIKTWPW